MADESKTSSTTGNQEWRLVSRPAADVSVDNMKLVDVALPEEVKEEGGVLLRAKFFSVDPYMRGQMNAGSRYIAGFQLNKAMRGYGVAEVIKTNHADFKEGDLVVGMLPFRIVSEMPGAAVRKIDMSMTPGYSPSIYISILGITGLSAYFPVVDIAQPKEGDVAFVSGAAGAVGSVVGQLLKSMGCRVIGSAGTDEKVAMLKSEFGFDEAFNYKTSDVKEALQAFAPKGYNIYWDNVGGPMLDLMLTLMAVSGRIVCCGMISQYNKTSEERYGLKNAMAIVGRQLRVEGFLLKQYMSRASEGSAALAALMMKGKVKHHETVVNGFSQLAEALVGLFKGANTGKMIVKL